MPKGIGLCGKVSSRELMCACNASKHGLQFFLISAMTEPLGSKGARLGREIEVDNTVNYEMDRNPMNLE